MAGQLLQPVPVVKHSRGMGRRDWIPTVATRAVRAYLYAAAAADCSERGHDSRRRVVLGLGSRYHWP